MFSSYPRDTATSQDREGLPPLQHTTHPINNAFIHGVPTQPTGMEEATQEYGFGNCLAGLEQDYSVDPYCQTASGPAELHSDFPEHFPQPVTAGSNLAYMGNLSHQAIPWNAASVPELYQPCAFESPEVPTDLILPVDPVSSITGGPISGEAIPQQLHSDELWAKVGEDRIEIGLALREELKRASDRHCKRMRTADPDLGAGPSHSMAESEDRDGAESPDTRSTKRRKITMERKTEDRVAAQRGETQELRARRTSAGKKNTSKLGDQGLRKETLVAPSQGAYPPFSPRPTIGATLGPTEFEDQAWTRTEGSERISEGTEDVHGEEPHEERRTRLMVLEENQHRCGECGKKFFDRSTMRRHCKTVHGNEYEKWRCQICPDKWYSRKSGFDRHMKKKHV